MSTLNAVSNGSRKVYYAEEAQALGSLKVEAKALFAELQPKKGVPVQSYTSAQFEKVNQLLSRVKVLSPAERNELKQSWFLKFQALFIQYASRPDVAIVKKYVQNLVDTGSFEQAIQAVHRFQGGSLDRLRLYDVIAANTTSVGEVRRMVNAFPEGNEREGVLTEILIRLSIANGKKPYYPQFPTEKLLELLPRDDVLSDMVAKFYLQTGRYDLAVAAWNKIENPEKKNNFVQWFVMLSYPDAIRPGLFPKIGAFLSRWEPAPVKAVAPVVASPTDPVVDATPPFDGYKVAKGFFTHPLLKGNNPVLTGVSVSPAHLLFRALNGGQDLTTMPGQEELFRFHDPAAVREHILNADPKGVLEFSANGASGTVKIQVEDTLYELDIPNLAHIYGGNTYRISYKELQDVLASQKIFVSPQMPIEFYYGLKQALLADGIVLLPDALVKDLKTPACKSFIAAVRENPKIYGFSHPYDFATLSNLTLYQAGAMVVKTEDCRVLADSQGKIFERQAGAQDSIRLINLCGIRNMGHTHADDMTNKAIMRETFHSALVSAENGIVIFPAVGMGVWQGDPDIYWNSLLDSVANAGGNVEKIYINPGHKPTPGGKYKGKAGDEFQAILAERRRVYTTQGNKKALANLAKIQDLSTQRTDVVQLALNLKKAFPDKIISLVNASDPDVTLGNHVGEYTNNMPQGSTTEENYTRYMTNGLCFESITGVHQGQNRIFQVRAGNQPRLQALLEKKPVQPILASNLSPKQQHLKIKQADHLAKLKKISWEHLQTHTSHPDSGFDWWMFPIDRPSQSQRDKYQVSESDIAALKQDPEFMQNYREGVSLIAKSWGWDLETMEDITNKQQRWTGYQVRLGKMLNSLILFGEKELHSALVRFVDHAKLRPTLDRWVQSYLRFK